MFELHLDHGVDRINRFSRYVDLYDQPASAKLKSWPVLEHAIPGPGQSGIGDLTATTQNGFNSVVSFTCSGLPSGATCSFSPTTVTPSGGNAATTQLTISVSASSASALPASKRNRDSLFPGAALALTDVLFAFTRRRSLRGSLYLIIALGMLAGIAACGGGGAANGGGVNRVTSLVTVTATSGSIQQTASITLTVN